MAPLAPKTGDPLFANVERVNAELFTLTYGAIVRQLLADLEEVEEVNKQLDLMGYNIGVRLIDEFLAKSNVSRCVDFKETADIIAKVGFKMFLGVTATVTNWNAEGTTCSLVLEDNPLVDFVELPDTCQGLHYCNILSGVLRGALEMRRGGEALLYRRIRGGVPRTGGSGHGQWRPRPSLHPRPCLWPTPLPAVLAAEAGGRRMRRRTGVNED
ncbi:trafficking protein particle complex subunit 3-like isoform X1 [Phoenix dactylifera]|uniref:Trafficking protein particle complex subunit 3-like isoform X1 n=1 Tax=Phoenix dactylifera TaxID=42345 RepID=A0A8B8JAM2_PHODC|nr:trafficking protein particle complex subunit 3-like isoform X1 [Phoenix dactylifera]